MVPIHPRSFRTPGLLGEPGIQRCEKAEFRTRRRFQTRGLLTLEHNSPGRGDGLSGLPPGACPYSQVRANRDPVLEQPPALRHRTSLKCAQINPWQGWHSM